MSSPIWGSILAGSRAFRAKEGMMTGLVACSACGNPISKGAASCPKCGHPTPGNGLGGTLFGMAVFVGLLFVCAVIAVLLGWV